MKTSRRNFLTKIAATMGSLFVAKTGLGNISKMGSLFVAKTGLGNISKENEMPNELDGVPKYEIMTVDGKTGKVSGIYKASKSVLKNMIEEIRPHIPYRLHSKREETDMLKWWQGKKK